MTITIIITLGFMLMDIVTGNLLHLLILKDWKSAEMRTGLVHKLFFILCIVFGFLLDVAQTYANVELNTDLQIPFTLAFCGYIIICEIGSIKENLVAGNSQLKNLDINIRGVDDEQTK